MIDAIYDTLHKHDFRMVELEFRVGFQTNNSGFHSSVPKVAWVTAKNKLGEAPETVTIDRYTTTRRGEASRHVTTATETYWEHKKKIANELSSPGIRFSVRTSLALETRETGKAPNSFVLQRKKYRSSFTRGPWKIDFTRVETIPSERDVEATYEIEVELADQGYLFEKELPLVLEEGVALAKKIVE
jgi:hypothetical protein